MEMESRHILDLSKDEKRAFINSFDIVLSDCDGVVWTLSESIPGVAEGLDVLQNKYKKQVSFVTNNSFRPKEEYEKLFSDLGANFKYESNLVHPAASIISYLRNTKFEGLIFLIGSSNFEKLLKEAGFDVVMAPDAIEDGIHSTSEIIQKLPVKAIVFDIDLNFNWTKFHQAEIYLQDPDCQLILGATDTTYIINSIPLSGVAVFMEMLVRSTKKAPKVVGKPGSDLVPIILAKFNITDPKKVLFIGDTLEQDIGFANQIGFQSLLVLSGVTSKEMVLNHDKPKEIPNYYAGKLFDFVQFYNELI